MGKPITVQVSGKPVQGEELGFEAIEETWNTYKCDDGTIVRLKAVVTKVVRLETKDANGEHNYMTLSNNVLSVTHAKKS